MMYKCSKCGTVFDEFGVGNRRSYLCDYGTTSTYEDVACCPNCGEDDFYEVFECEICGKYEAPDDMYERVCRDCIDAITPRECFEMTAEKKTIEINEYLAECFSVSDIEHILLTALEEQKASTVEYTSSDKEWFAEKLLMRKEGSK